MSFRVAALLRERRDGHAFWAGHALLFPVGHQESTRCLCSIALFPAEVGMSRAVSAPRPERHPPRAGNLRSAVVLSLQFVHSILVTRAACLTNSTHVAGMTNREIDKSRCCHRISSFRTVIAASSTKAFENAFGGICTRLHV